MVLRLKNPVPERIGNWRDGMDGKIRYKGNDLLFDYSSILNIPAFSIQHPRFNIL